MDDLITEIQELITRKTTMETYENITHSISTMDDILKCGLKPHFPSANFENSFTTIAIKLEPLSVAISNSTIYMYGKYSKLSRALSQTPFKYAENSVADFTIYFKRHYDADDVNFIGCGREDVDVMCHERPFLLEIRNPKKNLKTHAVTIKLNQGVSIWDLKIVTKKYRNIFVTMTCTKTYNAGVKCTLLTDRITKGVYKLAQKTPIRVLHRRANIVRERTLEILDVVKRDDSYDVVIEADAGTYIKEFVSGDFGRTTPSLTTINGSYCECVRLDVIKVKIDMIEDDNILESVNITVLE